MFKIKKGDTVKIELGKDRDKTGKVERVITKDGKLLVAGINVVKKHVKKGVGGGEGGIIDLIKPIYISNVMLVCPNCKKPTRVGFKIEKGVKSRICHKCGKEIV